MKYSLAAMALFCAAAVAADASLDAARRCVQLADSLQRLVCFDRAFAGNAAEPAAPAAAPAPPAAPAAPVAPAAPAAAVAVAPAAAAAVAAAPQMGDSQLKRSSEERPEAAEPSRMTATVTALKETRKDVYRIWLDNGQVWQQMDLENLFAVKIGDTVQIERGKLGGFRMARGVNSRSGWTRVTRLK